MQAAEHNQAPPSSTKRQYTARKRGGIGGKPIRRLPKKKRPPAAPASAESVNQSFSQSVNKEPMLPGIQPGLSRLAAVWSDDWMVEINAEHEDNVRLGLAEGARLFHELAPTSTYRQRAGWPSRQACSEEQEQSEWKEFMLHLKWCAEARHASNMRDVPFSMMVDSLANLGRRLPRKRWKEDRSLVSYMSAHNYLYMLALLRPPPPFQVCVYASAYMWDQFYQKEHGNCKNGYSGTAGVKGDLSGHVWRNQTNLNWIEVILPVTAFMPTESELAEIIVCGPYTQPMGSVYPMLQPAKVCAPPLLQAWLSHTT